MINHSRVSAHFPPTRPIYILMASLVFGGVATSPAFGENLDAPFLLSNRNPLVQIFGIPPARPAMLAKSGETNFNIQFEANNSFTSSDDNSEAIFLDVESYVAEFSLQYGLGERWEFGARLPYRAHEGGFMDEPIESWHDFWGLPNGNRDEHPQDQIQIAYQRDGQLLLDFHESTSGLGDISLDAGYQLANTELSTWAIRAGVKLPSGDDEDLTGSGATDVYASMHYSRQALWSRPEWALHLSGGLIWMDDGDVIASRQESTAWFASSTLSWRAWDRIALKLQVDAHTAMYDSNLTEIGKGSAQLAFGASFDVSPQWVLDLSMTEDIYVDTAPDFGIQLNLRRYGSR